MIYTAEKSEENSQRSFFSVVVFLIFFISTLLYMLLVDFYGFYINIWCMLIKYAIIGVILILFDMLYFT